MTYKDKGSYESSPPYIHVLQFYNQVQEVLGSGVQGLGFRV